MSITTEQEILDRLYQALGEARKHAMLVADPVRLRMLTTDQTDYDRLYDAMELVEGCARQMTAWRQDARWEAVSLTVGTCLTQIRAWATPAALPLFVVLVDFLNKCEFTCRNLQLMATHRSGAILPDMIKVDRERTTAQVILPGPSLLQ